MVASCRVIWLVTVLINRLLLNVVVNSANDKYLNHVFCCMSLDEQSVALLEKFTADPEPLVAQSCQVALSMLEFEQSGKSFEV